MRKHTILFVISTFVVLLAATGAARADMAIYTVEDGSTILLPKHGLRSTNTMSVSFNVTGYKGSSSQIKVTAPSSSQVPTGMTVSKFTTSVRITGKPTVAGQSKTVTVTFVDSTGQKASATVTLKVGTYVPYPNFIPYTSDVYVAGSAGASFSKYIYGYGQDWTFNKQKPTITWKSGSAPTNVLVYTAAKYYVRIYKSSSSKVVTAGDYDFTIGFTDEKGNKTSRDFTLHVLNPKISTTPLEWTKGFPIDRKMGPKTENKPGANLFWTSYHTRFPNKLPPGVFFDRSAGKFYGTPTTVGTTSNQYRVYDYFLGAYTYGGGTQSLGTATPFKINDTPALTPTLPPWAVNVLYSEKITGTGGTGPFTWKTTKGAPPDGLSIAFGTTSASVTGTPTKTGTFDFTVEFKDAVGAKVTRDYSIVIAEPPSITSSPHASWTEGLTYYQSQKASGEIPPHIWSLGGGTLPPGLALTSGGLLLGTPTKAGTYTFTLKVSGQVGLTASKSFTVVVNDAVEVTAGDPATWTKGVSFSRTLSSTGGTGSHRFRLAGGALPTGMTLSPDGVLSGTPMSASSYAFTVEVTDSLHAKATKDMTWELNDEPTLGDADVSEWTFLRPLSSDVEGAGGTGPFTWSRSGDLPPGVSFSSSGTTGTISGTPTDTGSFTYNLTYTDSLGAKATRGYTLEINDWPQITTDSLPDWTRGHPFSRQIATSDGTGDLRTSIASGGLPADVTLGPTGLISGTPGATGTFSLTVEATDDAGATVAKTLSLKINPPVVVAPASIPEWTATVSFTGQTFTAAGGTGVLTFSATGLPKGMSLDSDGALSGTPASSGDFDVKVTATDEVGYRASHTTRWSVNPVPQITTTSAKNWTRSRFYSAVIDGTGGTASFAWSVSDGDLPNGLSLAANSPSATLSGTPSKAGSFDFTVKFEDAFGVTDTQDFSVTINDPPAITTPSITSEWTQDLPYPSVQFAHTGGTTPFTWLRTGSLPPGLALTPGGLLSGTPTSAGTSSFTVQVRDTAGSVATKSLSVMVNPRVSITPYAPPIWTENLDFTTKLNSAGGSGKVTWSVASGSLPAGMTLSPDGILSGAPAAFGSFSFEIQAKDSLGYVTTIPIRMEINQALQFVTTSVKNWTVGVVYNVDILGKGGTPTIDFTLDSGTLPSGLAIAFAGSKATLAGVPDSPGVHDFTLRLRDSVGADVTQAFMVTINEAPVITLGPASVWTQGFAYARLLEVQGGSAPFEWKLASGALPGGLTFDKNGLLSGTPSSPGEFSFDIKVTDDAGESHSRSFTMRIADLVQIIGDLPDWTAWTGFSHQLKASGGTGAKSWTHLSGSFPAGVSLSGDGVLSGTPTNDGTFQFILTATDALGSGDTRSFTWLVNPQLTINTNSLPEWTAGRSFARGIFASGGTPSHRWEVSAGRLPPGLVFGGSSLTSLLTGTPTQEGDYNFTIQITDSVGALDAQAFDMRINPAIRVSGAPPILAQGRETAFVLPASGGTPPYGYAVTGGKLPSGMALDESSGVWTGAPKEAGLFPVDLNVVDSTGALAVLPVELNVAEPVQFGGKIGGSLGAADLTRLLFVDALIGGKFTFDLDFGVKDAALPNLALLDANGNPAAGKALKALKANTRWSLKNWVAPQTGRYYIRIDNGGAGYSGGFTYKAKFKADRRFGGAGTLGAPDFEDVIEFAAPGGSAATIQVKSGGPLSAAVIRLKTPDGLAIPLAGQLKGKGNVFVAKGVLLSKSGTYELHVKSTGPASFSASIKLKTGKGYHVVLTE